jgi:hypothetical protein
MGLGVSISSQLNALTHSDFPNMVAIRKIIGFGQSTSLRKEDGIIVVFARFASKLKRWRQHLYSHCRVKDWLGLASVLTQDWTLDLTTPLTSS